MDDTVNAYNAYGASYLSRSRYTTHVNVATGTMLPPSRSSSASPESLGSQFWLQESREATGPSVDRFLPSRIVTNDSIDEAYSDFILFANPFYPVDTDTAELKRTFRKPPGSDGKEFSIFRLWELLQKFDSKEIKTWAQLALDLGVEPPSVEKGGSVQKVQQYSVRLKRWMRAMHVDAFFEYLLGKDHIYFMELPPPHEPHPAQGRDGVPAEEDLAVRALDPTFRPKRGRKRNESPDDGLRPSKRPVHTAHLNLEGQTAQAQPTSAYPSSGVPLSAYPDGYSHDPWASVTSPSYPSRTLMPRSAIATATPQHLRWRHHDPAETPDTPHPMSAIAPSTASHFNEPPSAVPQSAGARSRPRRKHGPAVSSAWSRNSANSKPRGRPPSNRSIQDGPFCTFPADPNAERLPMQLDVAVESPLEQGQLAHYSSIPNVDARLVTQGKPSRISLQLQVPPHSGGPVHLLTPTVLSNGETSGSSSNVSPRHSVRPRTITHNSYQPTVSGADRMVMDSAASCQRQPQVAHDQAYESLKRALAADLVRSEFVGRRSKRLSTDEAKRLSDALLARLGVHRSDDGDKIEHSEQNTARIAAASWLGFSPALSPSASPFSSVRPGAGTGTKYPTRPSRKIFFQMFGDDGDGYDVPLTEEDLTAADSDPALLITKCTFDVSWSVGLGPGGGEVSGEFSVKGLELDERRDQTLTADKDVDDILQSVKGKRHDEVDWKKEFMMLSMQARFLKGQIDENNDRVLDALLAGM